MSNWTEFDYLRDLYLEDLGKMVTYHKNPRPRVRHVETWQKVGTKLMEGVAEQLPPTDPSRKVWLWSDLHFGHKNIINFSDRPFPDMETMQEHLIENFCEYVGPNDISIWVGDITFMANDRTNALLDRCPGHKILVVGNHDFNKKKIRNLNFDEICLLKHFDYDGVSYVCTHYPMDNLPLPYINLHGHLHAGAFCDTGNIQHINVNCEFHSYRPVELTELHKIAKTRVNSMELG